MPKVPDQKVMEGASCLIETTLRDYPDVGESVGNPISRSAVGVLTMTLFDKETGDIINTHTDTDVKDSLAVSGGSFLHELIGADNPIVGTDHGKETHIALIEGTATVGAYSITLKEEIFIEVIKRHIHD